MPDTESYVPSVHGGWMITAGEGGVYLDVHVQPGAGLARVAGRSGDGLKIAVRAPAESGRANQEVVVIRDLRSR